jgi:predicted transcriptional regulator
MPSEYTIAFVSNKQQIRTIDDLAQQEGRTRSSMLRNLIDIGIAYYERINPPVERAVRVLAGDERSVRQITAEAIAQELNEVLQQNKVAPVPAGAADADMEA